MSKDMRDSPRANLGVAANMFSNVFATCNCDFCAKGTSIAITCYRKTTATCCIFLPSDHWTQMLLQCLDVTLTICDGSRTCFSSLGCFIIVYRAQHCGRSPLPSLPSTRISMGLLSPQISLSGNGGIWPESAARDPLQLVDTQHVLS